MGGLLSYGVDGRESYRRAATYVDRILKGAKRANLPIELPTKLQVLINLKTANALGLTIPPSLLVRADEVPSRTATGHKWPGSASNRVELF